MSIALKAGTTTLSTAYTISKESKPTQIINHSLDGTTFVQTIGEPAVTYQLRAVIDDETARIATDDAWQAGTPITANDVAIGVITSVKWSDPLPGGRYLADIATAV